MDLLKIIKNNLFVQNFVASIVSIVPPYLEFTAAKYLAIKKAMFITAHDATRGNYLEFGVFTGSSFNFAMKVNKKIEKIFGKMDCEFIGFDSFKGFGEIKKEDENPAFKDHIFSVNEKKVLQNIQKCAKGQKMRIIKGFYKETIKNSSTNSSTTMRRCAAQPSQAPQPLCRPRSARRCMRSSRARSTRSAVSTTRSSPLATAGSRRWWPTSGPSPARTRVSGPTGSTAS